MWMVKIDNTASSERRRSQETFQLAAMQQRRLGAIPKLEARRMVMPQMNMLPAL